MRAVSGIVANKCSYNSYLPGKIALQYGGEPRSAKAALELLGARKSTARNEVEATLTAPRQPRDLVGAHHYSRGRIASRVKRCLNLSSHLPAGNEGSIWAKKGVKKKQDNLGDF